MESGIDEGRVPCTVEGCGRTILPQTAKRTGGICRPCEQRFAREAHEAYVRANQRVVDPYAGVSDPLELLALLLESRPRNELIVEKPFEGSVAQLVATLSPQQTAAAHDLAISYLHLEAKEDRWAQLSRWLACFSDVDLTRLQLAAIAAGTLYPSIVFRGARPSVVQMLLDSLPDGPLGVDQVLLALAWAGGDAVRDQFALWRRAPPVWRERLHIAPHQYASEAAWELDEIGNRRELSHATAFALVAANGPGLVSPVRVGLPSPATCPWCSGPLSRLLWVDNAAGEVADLHLPPLVETCALCTCYGPIFMQLDGNSPRWHSHNMRPKYLPAERGEPLVPTQDLVLGPRRGPLGAADWTLPTSLSQLGGVPGWIQDAGYPTCPGCSRTMRCIAQIAVDEIEPPAEGMYYALWCAECRVTATTYQQT